MASDPRYRTKVMLDTYWTPSNATDDDDNSLGVQVMYAYPEYPFEMELKSPSVEDVIITVDQPTSRPMMDPVTEAPRGYEESMPVEIITTDKTGVTAIKALWQAEAEMRRILEEYPRGSLRSLERTRPATKRLGSTVLWSARYVWNYRRDIDT